MRTRFAVAACLALVASAQTHPAAFRLLKSESGPSGKVSGNKFILDEVRSRFTYPQDRVLVVSCEFEGKPGQQSVTAIWKDPDGKPAFLSADIRLDSTGNQFAAYWTYYLNADMRSGLWQVEFKVNGQPVGSHVFQVEVPPPAPPPPPPVQPAERRVPSLDEMYKSILPSLVWIRKQDGSGRRFDLATGFVAAPGIVATAFQAVDSAARIEIEFADGRKVLTDKLLQWNRLGDWALIQVDTGAAKPLPRGDPKSAAIGERLIVFNVDPGDVRAIGGVDISGAKNVPEFGERIFLQPSPSHQSAGGPLFDRYGGVVGMIGGSVTPGARFSRRNMSLSGPLFARLYGGGVPATPIALIPANPDASAPATPLFTLAERGVLTPPLDEESPDFLYGGTGASLPAGLEQPIEVSEFYRRDPSLVVHTTWTRKTKLKEHMIGASIFDSANRLRVKLPPGKVKVAEHLPTRHSFSIVPGTLTPGVYRVDILAEDRIVWRTFFQIID